MIKSIIQMVFAIVLIYNFIKLIRQKKFDYKGYCSWMILSALIIGLTFITVKDFLFLANCTILITSMVQFFTELYKRNIEARYCLRIIFSAACIALRFRGEIVILKVLLILYCLLHIFCNLYTIRWCPEDRNVKLLNILLSIVTLLLCIRN